MYIRSPLDSGQAGLGRYPGDLEVSLLLMKVDSPEFRALMDLAAPKDRDSGRPI